MTCDCISVVDAKLAEHNTRIMFSLMLGSEQTKRPMIVTEQIESGRGKKKAVGMFASCCPFCGVKLGAAAVQPDALVGAAAPEMLKALESLDAFWSEDGATPDDPHWSDDMVAVWKQIRGAIAKAKGGAA